MLNRIIIIGRLTRDPEPRYTASGMAVTRFNVAVGRTYVNKQGERVDETDFIDVVTWSKLAETCANYLNKGRLVAVEGRLRINSYEDSQGIRRKNAEIVADTVRFLDRGRDAGSGYSTLPNAEEKMPGREKEIDDFASEISFSDDEEVPF
ncbi:single-stranded DNA-binding protein [Peptococcaceae bacterium]|nr:single-stranded DNA-binding protein [Peptococcaceae bacterium]MCL0043820.1 single-stranded DNA-binding protein [Peptococcaceae bacterium]MCL0100574.1 single-stranded DNA-binding protein [Peptococcaceae bacterium]